MSKECKIVLLCVFSCALASFMGAGIQVRLILAGLTLGTIAWAMLLGRALGHPAEALLVTWAIPWSFHFLHLLYFGNVWPQGPLLYVAAFVGCYCAGFYLTGMLDRCKIGKPPDAAGLLRSGSLRGRERVYDFCAILGLLSAFAAYRAGSVLSGGDFSDLAAIREAFNQTTIAVSGWSYVLLFTSPGGIVCLVTGLLYQEELSKKRRLFYVFAGFATIAGAVFSAGRYLAVLVTVLTLICFAIRRRAGKPAVTERWLAWGLCVMVLGLVAYMLVLPSLRDAKGVAGFAEFAHSVAGVDAEDALIGPLENLPSEQRDATYASYVYLAMPLENFCIFAQVYKGSPRFGALEESLLARQISRIFPQLQTSTKILADRDEENAAAGEATTSWQTMARDAVIDFGWTGALVFAWGLGWLGRRVYRNALSTGKTTLVLALAALCFISFHSIMYSIIGDLNLLVLLSWGWILRGTKRGERRTRFLECSPGEMAQNSPF